MCGALWDIRSVLQQGLCSLLSVLMRAEMIQILLQFHYRPSMQHFLRAASRFQMSNLGIFHAFISANVQDDAEQLERDSNSKKTA